MDYQITIIPTEKKVVTSRRGRNVNLRPPLDSSSKSNTFILYEQKLKDLYWARDAARKVEKMRKYKS